MLRPLKGAAIACLCPLVLAVGCGNSRTQPRDFTRTVPPSGWKTIRIPEVPLAVDVPANWSVGSGGTRLVVVSFSGLSVVEIWRYARRQPPPATTAALRRAKNALVRAAKASDPRLHVIRSRVITLAGLPTIELSVTETVAGQLRRDRSLHVFTHGTELVLDTHAPANEFHAVDHAVFSPIKRSLRPA